MDRPCAWARYGYRKFPCARVDLCDLCEGDLEAVTQQRRNSGSGREPARTCSIDLAIVFHRRLVGESTPHVALERFESRTQVSINDLLSGKDFLELSVVGSPSHPLRLGNTVPYATPRPQLAT
jgi:hypothetical protein